MHLGNVPPEMDQRVSKEKDKENSLIAFLHDEDRIEKGKTRIAKESNDQTTTPH